MKNYRTAMYKKPSCKTVIGSALAIFVTTSAIAAHAELAIPNPLIKPQQITPLSGGEAGNSADKRSGNQQPNQPNLPGGKAGALPPLPMMPDGPSKATTTEKTADPVSTIRNLLSYYKVTLASTTLAVLRAPSIPPRIESAATNGGSTGSPAQVAAPVRAGAVQGEIVLQPNTRFVFQGEPLFAILQGEDLAIYHLNEPKEGRKKHSALLVGAELVFFGGVESTQRAPYVPDGSKLEKPDSRYHKSVQPNKTSAGTNTSSSPQSGANPNNPQP